MKGGKRGKSMKDVESLDPITVIPMLLTCMPCCIRRPANKGLNESEWHLAQNIQTSFHHSFQLIYFFLLSSSFGGMKMHLAVDLA